MPTNTIPKTCSEAAERLRRWAYESFDPQSYCRYVGAADVLEAFGDQPIPQALLNNWDFAGRP